MLWLMGQTEYECMSSVIHGAQTVSHTPKGVIGGKTDFLRREHHLDLPTVLKSPGEGRSRSRASHRGKARIRIRRGQGLYPECTAVLILQ